MHLIIFFFGEFGANASVFNRRLLDSFLFTCADFHYGNTNISITLIVIRFGAACKITRQTFTHIVSHAVAYVPQVGRIM